MAKLTVNGHTVTVDDSFKSLTPDEQNATVDEIARSLPSQVASTAKIEPPHTKGDFSLDNVVRSVANGVTFGLADRFAAGMGALTGVGGKQGEYSQNLKGEQEKTRSYQEQHPVLSAAGNIAGNVASIPFLPEKLVGGALTGPMLSRVGTSAGAGAALGGVQGVADSPDWTDVGRTAAGGAGGALVGGSLGAATPLIGKVAGAGASALADALRGYGPELSGPAGRSLSRAMKTLAPGELEKKLQNLGDDATLMDTSPAFIGKGQGVAANSPEARVILSDMLKARSEGTSNRLFGDVNENFGTAYSKDRANLDMQNFRSKQDRKNYGSAFRDDPHVAEVDVQSLLDYIDSKIPKAEVGELQVLTNLKKQLLIENPEYAPAVEAMQSQMQTAENYMPKAATRKSNGARGFARGAGGLRDEGGDLASQEINKEMVGLLRKKGRNLDDMRKEMAQSGYFDEKYGSADAAYNEATPNDVLEAIEKNSTPAHAADDEWLKNAERQGGGRSWLRGRAEELAKEHNDDLRANLPPEMLPKTQAENLHKIKGALDDLIEYPDRKALGVRGSDVSRSQGALSDLRGRLNRKIEQNVEGYAEANDASEAMAKRQEALKSGYERVLGTGPESYWTSDLARDRAAMEPGERAAQAMGVRARIEEKLRRTANDLTAGKSVVGGENDFNRGNLAEVFGEEPTQNLVRAVEREKEFANTANRINGNSFTAERGVAAREESPVNIGHLANLKRAVLSPIVDRISERLPLSSQYYPEMAKALSATGKERDKYIKILAKGLQRSKATEQAADKFGSRAALAAALAANNTGRSILLPTIDVPGRQ